MLIGSPEIHEAIVTDTGTHGMPMNLVRERRQFTWRRSFSDWGEHNAPGLSAWKTTRTSVVTSTGAPSRTNGLYRQRRTAFIASACSAGSPGNDAHRRNLPRLPDDDADDDGG